MLALKLKQGVEVVGGGGGNELKNTVGNSLPLAASKRVGTLLLQTQEIELC